MRGFISSLLLLCFFLFLSNLQFCSGCCVLNNAINNGSSCECSYNGINTTFSEQIIVVENSLLITNPEPSNFLSLNLTSNTSAWFNQTSGFSIKATVFNVSLEPIYTDDEDRSGYNDNAYQIFSTSGQAQLDYLNILNTSCRYPVPNYYSVNVQQLTMVSGLNQINCSDPTVSSNSRYGCPRSSLYYRYYDPNCLSPACSATQGVPSIPSSMENWQIFCISQVQVLDQMFPNCTSQQNALVACKQNTSNSCTAQQNAYDACYTSHPSICSNDQSCSEGTVYQLPLSPQFPSNSQDYNCDLDYIRQGNLYSVEFDFYFNGIYFGQTVFEIGSDNLTAAFHQNGNEFLGDVFYLEHNLNTQLRSNVLLQKSGSNYCTYFYYSKSLELFNTDTWYMYSYSSPFYVAQQKADNINPFSGYSTLTTYYENGEPLSASSNSLPTAEEILFLTSGFSLNCSLVQPTYYAYNISNVCENNMVLFANYSYKIPNSKLTDVTLTASVINNGNSILGLMYPRGLLQFQSLAVDISVDVSGYTITFQGQLAQCNAYFTVELQEGYNTLSSYQVVVSCLNNDPFFIYFQIPLNQEEKEIVANYTETLQSEGQTVNPQTINVAKLLNQTRDFSLLLIDSFQAFSISPELGYYGIDVTIEEPLTNFSWFLSSADRYTLTVVSVGLFLVILLWVLYTIYASKVKNRNNRKASYLSWKEYPITKFCWKLQDMIPNFSKKKGYFNSKKHLGVIFIILFTRVVRAATFSFTFFAIFFLLINNTNFRILDQVPDFYSQVQERNTNISASMDLFRALELQRQNTFIYSQISNCDLSLTEIQQLISDSEQNTTTENNNKIAACNITQLEDALNQFQMQADTGYFRNYEQSALSWQKNAYREYDHLYSSASTASDLCHIFCTIKNDFLTFLPVSCNFPYLPPQQQQPTYTSPPNPQSTPVSQPSPPPPTPPSIAKTVVKLTPINAGFSFDFPSLQVPKFSFNFSLNWHLSLTWFNLIVRITFALDAILFIRKMIKAIVAMSKAIEGENVNLEEEVHLYDKNRREANWLKSDESATENLATGLRDKFFLLIKKINGSVAYALKKWPMYTAALTYIYYSLWILAIILGIIFIIYALLSPGFLENIGIVSLIVNPLQLQLYVTNQIIIENAYRLNRDKIPSLEEEMNQRLTTMQTNLVNFNFNEVNRVKNFNTEYKDLEKTIAKLNTTANFESIQSAGLPNLNIHYCSPIVAAQASVNFSGVDIANYSCSIQPVEGRIYVDFNSTEYIIQVSNSVAIYAEAIRGVIRDTLYFLLGVVLFYFFQLYVLEKTFWNILRSMGAIRQNNIVLYNVREHDPESKNFSPETEDAMDKLREFSERWFEQFLTVFLFLSKTNYSLGWKPGKDEKDEKDEKHAKKDPNQIELVDLDVEPDSRPITEEERDSMKVFAKESWEPFYQWLKVQFPYLNVNSDTKFNQLVRSDNTKMASQRIAELESDLCFFCDTIFKEETKKLKEEWKKSHLNKDGEELTEDPKTEEKDEAEVSLEIPPSVDLRKNRKRENTKLEKKKLKEEKQEEKKKEKEVKKAKEIEEKKRKSLKENNHLTPEIESEIDNLLKISEETFTQFYAVFNSISIQKSKFANPKPNDPETITPEEKNEITSICDSIKNLLQWAKEKYPSIKQDFELDIKTTLINKNRGKVVEHLTKLETHLLEVVKKVN